MKNSKKAISLIVLVITIIVMVVLAGAIILTLENDNTMVKADEAVNSTNEKQVQQLATLLWAEAYAGKNTSLATLEEHVRSGLVKNGIDLEDYTINITINGVEVHILPESWKASVSNVADEVPIPKGFVVSPYEGENKRTTGLVIYALTESEVAQGLTSLPEDETYQESLTTRDQFVWVPVAEEEFTTKFVRSNFGSWYTLATTLGANSTNAWWEVELDENNLPKLEQTAGYMSSQTLTEVTALYASVQKYEGFYIGRYEAGVETQRTSYTSGETLPAAQTKMNKIPYTYIPWSSSTTMSDDKGGMVEIARGMYNNTSYGVVSTLTYAVQWDSALQWLLDTKALLSIEDCVNHGNYKDVTIDYEDLNEGAQYCLYQNWKFTTYQAVSTSSSKNATTSWCLSTGALKVAQINNIYDMAGNVVERTMEGYNVDKRAKVGGSFVYNGSEDLINERHFDEPTDALDVYGFRPSLYIK